MGLLDLSDFLLFLEASSLLHLSVSLERCCNDVTYNTLLLVAELLCLLEVARSNGFLNFSNELSELALTVSNVECDTTLYREGDNGKEFDAAEAYKIWCRTEDDVDKSVAEIQRTYGDEVDDFPEIGLKYFGYDHILAVGQVGGC